jgi:hypothetical protein
MAVPEDGETSFDSELLDLSTVPLAALRNETPALRKSLRHVLAQTDQPTKTMTTCSSLAGLD